MDAKKKLFNSRPIFYGFLALLLALSTTRFLFKADVRYIIFDIVLLLIFLSYCIWAKRYAVLCVVIAMFAFGMGWWFVGLNSFQKKTYSETCQVVARVSDGIQKSQYGMQTVVLKDVYINGEKASNIQLYINSGEVNVGDIISFEGYVENAKLFTLNSFNSFYYRNRTPYVCMINGDDYNVQGNQITWLESFRMSVRKTLVEKMGETQGEVAFAALFGDKSGVAPSVKQDYQSAGVIHLLTTSGLHISFLIGILGFILKKCRVRGFWNFLVCAIFIILYAALCNFSPAILRAGIMGLVLVSTMLSGKCYDGLNSLGLAGIIILLFMPLSAMDLGFLMSFFSVLAIMTTTPWLKKQFNRLLPKSVSEALAVSIAAQLGLLPFLAKMCANFNFLTFFVNLIVIPVFSVIYPLCFISVLLTELMPFMGFTLSVLGWGFKFIQIVAIFFGQTYFSVNLETWDIFFIASIFVFMFLLSRFFLSSKKTKAVCCSSVAVVACICLGVSYVQFPTGASLTYCFYNRGSVAIFTNSKSQSLLIDFYDKDFTRQVMNAIDVKNISAVALLQKSTIDMDEVFSLGTKQLVRCSEEGGVDEEYIVSPNEHLSMYGFDIVYKSIDGKLIGIEVSFDDTRAFVFKDLSITVSALNSIVKENYDFVLLGTRTEYASAFPWNTRVLTYYQSEYSSSSFAEHGNLSYAINGKNYKRRCLD